MSDSDTTHPRRAHLLAEGGHQVEQPPTVEQQQLLPSRVPRPAQRLCPLGRHALPSLELANQRGFILGQAPVKLAELQGGCYPSKIGAGCASVSTV